LLALRRGYRNRAGLPLLVEGSGGETWRNIDAALRLGVLIARERGVRNRASLPRLTVQAILAWADAHHQRTGSWPTAASGAIPAAPGETWLGVNLALAEADLGVPGQAAQDLACPERFAQRN
jgi:hypothetical protein